VDRPDVQVSRVSAARLVPHVVVRNRRGFDEAGDGWRNANGQRPTRCLDEAFHCPESGIERPPRLDPGKRRLWHPGFLGQLPLTQIGPPTQRTERLPEIGSAGFVGVVTRLGHRPMFPAGQRAINTLRRAVDNTVDNPTDRWMT